MSRTADDMTAPVKAKPERKKSLSHSSTHLARSHFRIRNPFRRRSSDAGGSSSEHDPPDTVPHVAKTFDKTLTGDALKREVLFLLQKLAVAQWRSVPIELAGLIIVRKIFGALTNSIYQIALPDDLNQSQDHNGLLPLAAPKLLMRIYGTNVEHLIDRTHELVMLQRLSMHNIGPRLLGTFTNGRFEQWLDSHTLSRLDLRDPNLSCSIARRMRELHDGVRLTYTERRSPPTVWTSIDKWLPHAREIIARRRRKETGRLSDKNLPMLAASDQLKNRGSYSDDLILGRKWAVFEIALGRYRLYMDEQYPPEKLKHDLAFCHNDAQYGNILRIENQEQLAAPDKRHRQLIVIDFEYAAPNPRAYDLANHFCEWMYNYHSAIPYIANTEDYPTAVERSRFLEAYVAHGGGTQAEKDETVRLLEQEIMDWRVASHAFWCLWGVVMSEDDPEIILQSGDEVDGQVGQEERPVEDIKGATAADFDYIAYSDQKMRLFWGELACGRMYNDYQDGVERSKIINDSR